MYNMAKTRAELQTRNPQLKFIVRNHLNNLMRLLERDLPDETQLLADMTDIVAGINFRVGRALDGNESPTAPSGGTALQMRQAA